MDEELYIERETEEFIPPSEYIDFDLDSSNEYEYEDFE